MRAFRFDDRLPRHWPSPRAHLAGQDRCPGSMAPTADVGQRVFADHIGGHGWSPKEGDIIVFKAPGGARDGARDGVGRMAARVSVASPGRRGHARLGLRAPRPTSAW